MWHVFQMPLKVAAAAMNNVSYFAGMLMTLLAQQASAILRCKGAEPHFFFRNHTAEGLKPFQIQNYHCPCFRSAAFPA